jgi:hypothetical protein
LGGSRNQGDRMLSTISFQLLLAHEGRRVSGPEDYSSLITNKIVFWVNRRELENGSWGST